MVVCKRKDEEKILHKHNVIILPQLYQTEVLFRSHDQMGHQGIDKVQQRILHRFPTTGQLRVVDQLLDPREMELPDAAYEGTRLADDPRYGKPCGNTQLAKTLAAHDRADPAAARVVIVAGSDFEGTSPKLFWPETLIYSLPERS